MKKYAYLLALAGCLSFTPAYASDIARFMLQSTPKSKPLNCAYKNKIASKKCAVSIVSAPVSREKNATLTGFYGKNGEFELLSIQWPDGDVSRYALMDSFELLNLSNKKTYNFALQDENYDLDLDRGLVILDGQKEHVRLW